ncbi:putative serine protein kinase, PrkA [Alicyclobacillus hesperidum URH17-3-68]|nr:putative serine protein kinase, PrkA [Alicyclobacillus hesperidum URH17-3-68]
MGGIRMLSTETKSIILSTVPVLEKHGEAITGRFYHILFSEHPELLNLFNQTNQRQGKQQTALANAVYAAAAHIDNLSVILPVVQRIAEKHRALGVTPDQYPIVGETLLKAIKDVLGDAATPEIMDAWAQAYGAIADVFISVEQELYREAAEQPGGWRGFREFIVRDKVKESEAITSFYLEPADGKAIASYTPGQYLTFLVQVPGQPYLQRRHYSLSDAPGKPYYRISVKREAGINGLPDGIVSTYLHDTVQTGDKLQASAPAGDFKLDTTNNRPIVLLSGGVGMTPLISMAQTLAERGDTRPIVYIHSAIEGSVHAFDQQLRELAQQPNFSYHVVYERPQGEDERHPHFAKSGFVDRDLIERLAPADATFYFCGPTPYMRAVYKTLHAMGIEEDRIRFEFFGPTSQLVD